MVPKTISHNGTYDKESNTITWHNLTCDTNELKLHYYNIQDENCYSPWLDEDPDYMPIPGIPVGYTTTLNIPVNVTATADNAAVIPDKALKDSILKELNKTDDYVITRKDMESITSLNLANKKIYNIEGLQLCSNLKTIDLSNNRISKIVPLSNLKNIESVNLSNNRIDDISCLYGNTTTLPKYDITNQNVILPFATYNGYYYRLPNAITFILTTYLLIL